MALTGRGLLKEALRALEAEEAGGPRAELPPELSRLTDLLRRRDERLSPRGEPERELLYAIPDAAGLVARDGTIRAANARLESLSPTGRATGMTPLEVTRAADLAEAVKRALQGHAKRLELELPASRRTYLALVQPLLRGEALLILEDVSEARRA